MPAAAGSERVVPTLADGESIGDDSTPKCIAPNKPALTENEATRSKRTRAYPPYPEVTAFERLPPV